MNFLEELVKDNLKKDPPLIKVGSTVKVYYLIKEGERERVQIYEGTVIAIKHGGICKTFTVRKTFKGFWTEKVFPVHSPSVQKVEIVSLGKVRRGKLYYLRQKIGKATKLKKLVAK